MSAQRILGVVVVAMLMSVPALAQALPEGSASIATRFVDSANGVSLADAIARALAEEPSLRAARSEVDVARGMERQAGFGPNPSVSFERREEPSGTDNLTMVSAEWPLDLFRKHGRTFVENRRVATAELAVADRARRLSGDVRRRYGEVLAAVRELAILEDLVNTTRQQSDVVGARVNEGAAPPLERDLVDVEVQRLESNRLVQVGRTEAALLQLKRLLAMRPSAPLTVRDTLEQVVERESMIGAAPASTAVGEQRADVREAEARVTLADAKIDRAERDGRFDLSLYGTYMRMDAGFPQLGLTADGAVQRVHGVFHYAAGGVRLTMPLINRNQGEIAAARAERVGATAGVEAARLTAETEIAAARLLQDRAHQAIKMYRGSIRALAKQNLSVMSQSYELGRVTMFDVLTEQRRYLELERAYTDALREAYEARTALEVATGGPR